MRIELKDVHISSSYSSLCSTLMAFVFAKANKSLGHATFKRNVALKFGSSKHGKIFRAYAAAEKVVAIYLLCVYVSEFGCCG